MRPVRLTMQAFGPYAGRQVVDFRGAVEAGLFGLYGPTGSGKSSVFSAITFALFGESAKSEQDAPSLRSHHAEADMATEVEFVFDMGDRRYVVHRLPEQMRPKKKGDGETRDAHAAFVFDATGIALADITEGRRGKVKAEKKVGAVNAFIVDLLGYGAEQFRQVVLLPQGQFEKFLSARTKERLDILRDLFDVSLYRSMAAHMKDKAREAETHVRHERAVCAGRLSAEGFGGTEALAEGIAGTDMELARLRDIEAKAQDAVDRAQATLVEAKKIEERFDAAGKAQAALARRRDDNAAMLALADRTARAEKAQGLIERERRVAEAATRVQAARAARDLAVKEQERTGKIAEDAAGILAAEIAREGEIDGLRGQVETLERHGKVLEKSEGARGAVEAAVEAEQVASRACKKAQMQFARFRGQLDEKVDGRKVAQVTADRRRTLTADLAGLKSSRDVTIRFGDAEKAVRVGTREAGEATDLHARAVIDARDARAAFEVAEAALAETHALHLASKLEAGQPCPVCGADKHPDPATGTIDHAGRDGAFRAARGTLQRAEAAATAADATKQAKAGILADRQAQLDILDRPADDLATLEIAMRECENALALLAPAVDPDAAHTAIETLEEQVRATGNDAIAQEKTLGECRTATAVERARLDEMLGAVPEKMRERAALNAAMARASGALNDRQRARANAGDANETARDLALSARKECEGAEKTVEDRHADHGKAMEALRDGLAAADLTDEAFAGLKPAIATIEGDRKTVADHRVALGIAEGAAKVAEEAIREQIRPTLPEIEAADALARAALTDATDARSEKAQRLATLVNLRDDLADTLRKLDEEEAISGPLRNLAALFGGQNGQNLDLETFAIGAMFDRVLLAANQRLGPMTQHQYRLERDSEGSGRARRGLGTQVFDTHTGRTRPTATLSGGESFIAALALALGLADVVESVNGRVRLDTIFIDEGFGSLDTENGSGTLDRVLHTLRSLASQNRAIGLISHVPMVQDAIPNGFYVHKHPAGSSIETRGGIR